MPTQLPISQLVTTLVYHTWYQINAKTYEYYLCQICKLFNLIIHEFNEIIKMSKNVENQVRCFYKIAYITVAKCHRVPNLIFN